MKLGFIVKVHQFKAILYHKHVFFRLSVKQIINLLFFSFPNLNCKPCHKFYDLLYLSDWPFESN